MKKTAFLLFVLVGTVTVQAQEIKWITLDEALALQKSTPKPIFMDVYTDWCGPCKMLDKNTFQTKEVSAFINKNYYAVKFNGEGNSEVNYKGVKYTNKGFDPNRKGRNSIHDFTLHLELEGYPSMYILNEKSDVQKIIVGYRTPEQLLGEMSAQ